MFSYLSLAYSIFNIWLARCIFEKMTILTFIDDLTGYGNELRLFIVKDILPTLGIIVIQETLTRIKTILSSLIFHRRLGYISYFFLEWTFFLLNLKCSGLHMKENSSQNFFYVLVNIIIRDIFTKKFHVQINTTIQT